MLTKTQRTTILELSRQKTPIREIARTMNLSRKSVRRVLRSQSEEVPLLARPEKAEPFRQEIIELWTRMKGNLARVHEELDAAGAGVSYPALTAFCRRHGIGQEPPRVSGPYHFEAGEEIQHDTSPHTLELNGRKRVVQTASAVLAYSRMLFFQCYPTFQRFDCKCFLTDALRYFGGSASRVVIDNTHVVVLRGTGRDMVPVPEMAAFAGRFGFQFLAHERGDANRSGRVERPFHFIERNFLVGRSFVSWDDLNQQARQWCDRVNSTWKKHLRAIPRELFRAEQLRLKPLPVWIPEVYRVHERIVDVDGYATLHSNRYSVPYAWTGRRVELRETRSKIEIQLDARNIVTHERIPEAEHRHVTLAEHRPKRGERLRRRSSPAEMETILKLAPDLASYLSALQQHGRQPFVSALRQLLGLVRDYPRPALMAAISEAHRYGLYDLDRVERMILGRIARDFFLLDTRKDDDDE